MERSIRGHIRVSLYVRDLHNQQAHSDAYAISLCGADSQPQWQANFHAQPTTYKSAFDSAVQTTNRTALETTHRPAYKPTVRATFYAAQCQAKQATIWPAERCPDSSADRKAKLSTNGAPQWAAFLPAK